MEIARLCKYLPENDLKVSPAGAGALLAGLAPSGSGAPAGPPFLSAPDPRRHPVRSGPGGGPNAGRSDPVRPGVTRRAGEARVSRMLSRLPPWGREGCRGLCPKVAPPGLWATPGLRALTALRGRLLSAHPDPGLPEPGRAPADSALGMGSSPRGGDRSSGWPASDRRCRQLPGRGPSVFRSLRKGKTVGQSGLVVMSENGWSSLFPYASSQLLVRSVALVLLIQI